MVKLHIGKEDKMESKFNFYDIVQSSIEKKKNLAKINGRLGVIRGKSQSEEDTSLFAYAVDVLNDLNEVEDGWFIFEEDLIATGKKADPNKFSAGETARVRINPKTGKGEIVEKE